VARNRGEPEHETSCETAGDLDIARRTLREVRWGAQCPGGPDVASKRRTSIPPGNSSYKLDLPTVGVNRPLLATGEWPSEERDAEQPLLLARKRVGSWLRTRPGTRPLAVHAAWRTDPETALTIVRASRTPEPLRLARRAARTARAKQAP
jgi:Endonuclease V